MPHMPPGTQPFPRVPYAMNKGQQLTTVTSQVLAEIGWPTFDFHHVLSGYIDDCKPETASLAWHAKLSGP